MMKVSRTQEGVFLMFLTRALPLCHSVLQVLATRIVAVKASLCKLSTATAARACDFHAKLLLIAISSTLKSLLRPHVLNTPDKSPGDRLTEICAKNTDTGETAGGGGVPSCVGGG